MPDATGTVYDLVPLLHACGFQTQQVGYIIKCDLIPITANKTALLEILDPTEVELLFWYNYPEELHVKHRYSTVEQVIDYFQYLRTRVTSQGQPEHLTAKYLYYSLIGAKRSEIQDGHPGYSDDEIMELAALHPTVDPEDIARLLERHLPMQAIRDYQPAMTVGLYLLLYPAPEQIEAHAGIGNV